MSGTTCDTSVLVPALVGWHERHAAARAALVGMRALPAHVVVETYSVLTRLPGPHRIAAGDAAGALDALRLDVVDLPGKAQARLVADLGRLRLTGGAVYDALVAATVAHNGLELVTADRRARLTYDALGVRYSVLES